jgi:hypothetical protein
VNTRAAAPQSHEQLRYARLLEWGARVGLWLLVGSFALYMTGILPSHVSPQRLPELWSLPVHSYLQLSGAPVGWNWLSQLTHGDMAALSGVAWMAACSVPCLLSLLPLAVSRQRGDTALAALCVAEVLVIAVAASGWITGGH